MGYLDATGDVRQPYAWDVERRFHLRARLDALYFILYGVYNSSDAAASRATIRFIYSTFPVIEREEVAEYGRYRSRDLALAYINALEGGNSDPIVAE
jgi:hypothetical protein